jgi:S1-C subfamily serine protease
MIVQVSPGGPAARAGLQPFRRGARGEVSGGDIITAINEQAVGDRDDMLTLLEQRQPGEAVTLTLWRNGKTRKQALKLGAAE